jgi:hypothetical protein
MSTIRCPICLRMFEPDLRKLYQLNDQGDPIPLVVPPGIDEVEFEERTRNALVLCPSSPPGQPEAHYLQRDFTRYKQPIVIGLVGAKDTGKSTLLATMIQEIDTIGLHDYGLRARPLVDDKHQNFRRDYLDQLITNRRTLLGTPAAREGVQFVDGFLLIEGNDVPQPVVFFDVGGESFTNIKDDKLIQFIQTFTALLFVVDPDRATARPPNADWTFNAVSNRLTGPGKYLDKPTAIVLTKADKLRFEPTVARWLTEQGGILTRKCGEVCIDHDKMREESRDIFGFLYQREAAWAYLPFSTFLTCTLHAVSATGTSAPKPEQPGSATDPRRTYLRPLRSRRVLEPLVAILAMSGAITLPGADRVGRR